MALTDAAENKILFLLRLYFVVAVGAVVAVCKMAIQFCVVLTDE